MSILSVVSVVWKARRTRDRRLSCAYTSSGQDESRSLSRSVYMDLDVTPNDRRRLQQHRRPPALCLSVSISLCLCLCFSISPSVRPWICLPAGAFASLCVVPSMLTLDYVRKWNGFGELATALVQPSLRAQSIGCNFSQYPTASPNRPAKPRNILSKPINICSNFCHN